MAKNPAAVALGRLGGKAKTAAKAAASRENGKKGGRPRNHAPFCPAELEPPGECLCTKDRKGLRWSV